MKSKALILGGLISILFSACQPAQTSKNEKPKSQKRQTTEANRYNIKAMNIYNKEGLDASGIVLSTLDTALILDPDNMQTYKNKASVLAASKRYSEAQSILEIAREKKTKDYQIFVMTGFIEDKQGKTQAAQAMYKAVIAACSDSIKLYPDSAFFWAEKAFFEHLSEESGSNHNQMKPVLDKFPEHEGVKLLFEMFESEPDFRKKFIEGLFNNPKLPG